MQGYQDWIIILGLLAALVVVVIVGVFALRARRRRVAVPPAPKPTTSLAPAPERAPAPAPTEVAAPLPPAVPEPAPLTQEARVSRGLTRTKAFFQQTFDKLLSGSSAESFFGDLEEVLLTADIGVDFSENVVRDLKASFGLRLPARDELHERLSRILEEKLPETLAPTDAHPRVVMIVGVNGAGKTTTVGKLCQRFHAQNKKVLVGAADTFRAAAIDQLKAWVDRAGAEAVFQKEGSDPSAVAFDSVRAAASRGFDVCLIDTAGRLHTKSNLMEELAKMKRVITKALPGAPHDVWLVVDGSTGQNALNQAREFHQHLGLTGVVVTKLDGSAKGGCVLAIASELRIPVAFIGVGESVEDLVPFDGKEFIDAILAGL